MKNQIDFRDPAGRNRIAGPSGRSSVLISKSIIAQKRGPARETEINSDKFRQEKINLDEFRSDKIFLGKFRQDKIILEIFRYI